MRYRIVPSAHGPSQESKGRFSPGALPAAPRGGIEGGGGSHRKSRTGWSVVAVLGEGSPWSSQPPPGHPQPSPSQCLGVPFLLLKQWLWAPLPKLMPQWRRSSAPRSCCAWSVARVPGQGAQGQVPSHPLPTGNGLSLHFPQTLALPLDSLLIPFPCCPALGPTTPLTNSFPHFSSQIRTQAPHPPLLPKGGGRAGADTLSHLSAFLSPSLPLPDISSR